MARVLVVDDDPDVRGSLAECLLDNGFAVTTASDGIAGLECVRTLEIDLVLVDLLMPGMDGQHFMSELRRLPRHASIPVIVTTGMTTARADGADARLDKPFEVAELLEAVRRCLIVNPLDGDAEATHPSP